MAYYYVNRESEKEKHKARNHAIKTKFREYLQQQSCVDCGESRWYVLDFDHINGKKLGNISNMVSQGLSWIKIKEEIDKCQVRCANCHRERHYKERSVQSLGVVVAQ